MIAVTFYERIPPIILMTKSKLSEMLPIAAALVCAFMLVFFSDEASDAAYSAMNECAFTVIPSLFPYMVLSSLLVSSGAAEAAAKIAGKPLSRLLGVPPCSLSAIILGLLCGFPVGAKASLDMYRAGMLTDKETEHLIAISNNTGPAFIIEVAGRKYFGSQYIGVMFYIVELASAFIIAVIYGITDRKNIATGGRRLPTAEIKKHKSPSASFADAVADAARSSVVVSGFIVFFSVISGYASMICTAVGISGWKMTAVSAVLEFSGAVKQASLLNGAAGLIIASFAVNFAGLSVLAQSAALTDGCGISLRKCFVCKLAQGIAAAVITAILCFTGFVSSLPTEEDAIKNVYAWEISSIMLSVAAIFMIFVIVTRKNRVFQK